MSADSKKSKTGNWVTNSATLEPLAEQGHEIVSLVLDWRQFAKLRSTYTDSLPEQINPNTGRIHTSFSMAHTGTGRLSSTDPNLQNIPIRTEEGGKFDPPSSLNQDEVDFRRLLPNRAAFGCGNRRNLDVAAGVSRGNRYSCSYGVARVRRSTRSNDSDIRRKAKRSWNHLWDQRFWA
ncbi:hypothetical protein CCP2SC5_1890004 [Azospirillaceae bacterium]